MKNFTPFAAALFTGLLALASCTSENVQTQANQLWQFTVPDSINKDLVVAMYNEPEPAARVLLVYTDDTHRAARRISYFADGTTTTEPLELIRYNEFRAPESKREFVLRENKIVSFQSQQACHINFNWSSGSASSREYALLAVRN